MRVVLPVGRDVQVAAGREPQRERVHERRLAAAGACGGASSATGRERRRGCRRASRGAIIAATTSTASCWITRTLASASASMCFSRRRRPGRALRRRGSRRRGCACAIAAVVSPMPQPISSTRGARAAEDARRSRAALRANGMPKRGSSVSSARCCAGDIRPWRSTKLRIGARRRDASRSSAGASASVGAHHGGATRCPAGSASRRSSVAGFAVAAGVYSITQRVGVLPRRARVGPRLPAASTRSSLRTPSRVTRHTRELVDAPRRAEIGGDEALAVGREHRLGRQLGPCGRSPAAAA